MDKLNISLFDKFRATWGTEVLDWLGSGKAGELFCYLLLHRNRSHPREVLAELLWPDWPSMQSRKYLRQALWQLNSTLSSNSELTSIPLLIVDQSFININIDAPICLDVDTFEKAYTSARDVRGHELTLACATMLKDAVQLYRGDLLCGSFQDWCLYERERLRTLYLTMLDKLMGYCESHQEYEAGIAYGQRILYYEQAHERTFRHLMRLHYLSGDRTSALRQYHTCVTVLDRELSVKPMGDTVALYEQIKMDQLGTAMVCANETDSGNINLGQPHLITVAH